MRAVLRHREFRLLWLATSASTLGDRIVFIALALYVTEIGTPTDVGLVLAAHALPLVLFVLIGGVWADRLERHRVMVATDVIRAAAARAAGGADLPRRRPDLGDRGDRGRRSAPRRRSSARPPPG